MSIYLILLSNAILAEVNRIFQYLNVLALKFTTKTPVLFTYLWKKYWSLKYFKIDKDIPFQIFFKVEG